MDFSRVRVRPFNFLKRAVACYMPGHDDGGYLLRIIVDFSRERVRSFNFLKRAVACYMSGRVLLHGGWQGCVLDAFQGCLPLVSGPASSFMSASVSLSLRSLWWVVFGHAPCSDTHAHWAV